MEESIDLYVGNCVLIPLEGIGKSIIIDCEKLVICEPQQLQTQNGEHKSLAVSCECFSWFEANSVLPYTELSTSTSAQGIHESIKKIIDNMAFVIFTIVKIGIKFHVF